MIAVAVLAQAKLVSHLGSSWRSCFDTDCALRLTDKKDHNQSVVWTLDLSLTEILLLMERSSEGNDDAGNHVVNKTSTENDPQGSALSYEGPTPQPIQGGAPPPVPRAEVSRVDGVEGLGGWGVEGWKGWG